MLNMMTNTVFRSIILCLVALLVLSACTGKAPAKIGEKAPSISLPDQKGINVVIPDDFKNKVVLMLFWTENCEYCKKEMPAIESIYKTRNNAGLEVVAIQVGGNKNASSQLSDKFNLTFKMLYDQHSIIKKKLGVAVVPSIFILDREGRIAEKVMGGAPADALNEIITENMG